MYVPVESGAVTPLCYYGDLRHGRPSHEQQDVGMTSFSGGDWNRTRVEGNYHSQIHVARKMEGLYVHVPFGLQYYSNKIITSQVFQ